MIMRAGTATLLVAVALAAIRGGSSLYLGHRYRDTDAASASNQALAAVASSAGVVPVTYHGGSVLRLLGSVGVYMLFYGNWTGNSAVGILSDLVSGLGSTPWYGIATLYYSQTSGGRRRYVSPSLQLRGNAQLGYPLGAALTPYDVTEVVRLAISGGAVALDANAVYVVLTSSDVTVRDVAAGFGLCFPNVCGWHFAWPMFNTNVVFALVGDPPSQCSASSFCRSRGSSPNSNDSDAADGMAATLAHEIVTVEAVTDPFGDAWFDAQNENADRCSHDYGPSYLTRNGAQANMRVSGRDFMIQENWVPVPADGGYCAMAFNASSLPSHSPAPSPTVTRTPLRSRSATYFRLPTASRTVSRSRSALVSPSASRSLSRSPSMTRTQSRSESGSATMSSTKSTSRTDTRSYTSSQTRSEIATASASGS